MVVDENEKVIFEGELGLLTYKRDKQKTKQVTKEGLETELKRFIKIDKERVDQKLFSIDNIYDKILNKDIEINPTIMGKPTESLSNVYVNTDYDLVFNFNKIRRRVKPNGEVTERAYEEFESNLNDPENPLTISFKHNKPIEKRIGLQKYFFKKNYYIRHIKREQFDDLYNLAKRIQEKGLIRVIGMAEIRGKKRNVVVLRKGAKAYPYAYISGKAFIKDGKKNYLLRFHLSDRKLKIPNKVKKRNEDFDEIYKKYPKIVKKIGEWVYLDDKTISLILGIRQEQPDPKIEKKNLKILGLSYMEKQLFKFEVLKRKEIGKKLSEKKSKQMIKGLPFVYKYTLNGVIELFEEGKDLKEIEKHYAEIKKQRKKKTKELIREQILERKERITYKDLVFVWNYIYRLWKGYDKEFFEEVKKLLLPLMKDKCVGHYDKFKGVISADLKSMKLYEDTTNKDALSFGDFTEDFKKWHKEKYPKILKQSKGKKRIKEKKEKDIFDRFLATLKENPFLKRKKSKDPFEITYRDRLTISEYLRKNLYYGKSPLSIHDFQYTPKFLKQDIQAIKVNRYSKIKGKDNIPKKEIPEVLCNMLKNKFGKDSFFLIVWIRNNERTILITENNEEIRKMLPTMEKREEFRIISDYKKRKEIKLKFKEFLKIFQELDFLRKSSLKKIPKPLTLDPYGIEIRKEYIDLLSRVFGKFFFEKTKLIKKFKEKLDRRYGIKGGLGQVQLILREKLKPRNRQNIRFLFGKILRSSVKEFIGHKVGKQTSEEIEETAERIIDMTELSIEERKEKLKEKYRKLYSKNLKEWEDRKDIKKVVSSDYFIRKPIAEEYIEYYHNIENKDQVEKYQKNFGIPISVKNFSNITKHIFLLLRDSDIRTIGQLRILLEYAKFEIEEIKGIGEKTMEDIKKSAKKELNIISSYSRDEIKKAKVKGKDITLILSKPFDYKDFINSIKTTTWGTHSPNYAEDNWLGYYLEEIKERLKRKPLENSEGDLPFEIEKFDHPKKRDKDMYKLVDFERLEYDSFKKWKQYIEGLEECEAYYSRYGKTFYFEGKPSKDVLNKIAKKYIELKG